jgi:hypothetical protein
MAAVLGNRDERAGIDAAALGVEPAKQRLDTDHPTRDNVDLRLIL